jgi:hypothetical protein
MNGHHDVACAIIKSLPINDWTSPIIDWFTAWIQENPRRLVLVVISSIIFIASAVGIVTKSL